MSGGHRMVRPRLCLLSVQVSSDLTRALPTHVCWSQSSMGVKTRELYTRVWVRTVWLAGAAIACDQTPRK